MQVKELAKMMWRLKFGGIIQIEHEGQLFEVDEEKSGFKISSNGKKVLYLVSKTEQYDENDICKINKNKL